MNLYWAIQEIGGYSCRVNGIPSSSYPTPKNDPFSLWIKPRLKEIYGVNVCRIIKIV
jgi:dTDP-4-dehydrorhamnose reductase